MLRAAHIVEVDGLECAFVYDVLPENTCVYFSLSPGRQPVSSINRAEDIVALILKRENRTLASLRYLELGIGRDYNGKMMTATIGYFHVYEVSCVPCSVRLGGVHATKWHPIVCPPTITQLFRNHIMGEPRQSNLLAAILAREPNKILP